LACGELGLDVNYFYKLTQRQFYNTVNGYRKKEDYLSRERWQVARKIMFSYMCKYLGSNAKETDIITFPWEDNKVKLLNEEEEVFLINQQKLSEDFFARIDQKRLAKA